jgi:hypothetical protein
MRKKQNIITCKLTNNFNRTLDRFVKSGIPLEVGLGKYSAYIKTINGNYKYKFITKLQSKKTFIGYAKILKDLKRDEISVLLSDLKDNVKESNNIYYSQEIYSSCDYDNAICVDLNSAYLQALYNLSLITADTKKWIETNLSKSERLVCVGLLAKQKEILHFNKARIQQDYKEQSKNRFIFNAVIQEVANVMHKVKSNHLDDFIAYWVDGIYLKNEWIALDVVNEFEKAGFPCKIENITNFKSRFKFNYMEYTYKKDGKYKILNLPIKRVNENMRKNLLSMVNNYRLKNHQQKIENDYDNSSYYIASLDNKPYTQADLFD